MTTRTQSLTTKVYNVALGGAGEYFAMPDGYLTKDGGNVFLGAGQVRRIQISTALPASSYIQIIDAISLSTKTPIAGGSGVVDSLLDGGQFPITGPGVLSTTGVGSDGVLNLIDSPSGVDAFCVGAPTAVGSAPWALGAGVNGQVKAQIVTGPTSWEGLVNCNAGMIVRVVAGGAWTGTVSIDYYTLEHGITRYTKWKKKGQMSRVYNIDAVTSGNPTVVESSATVQIVPIGSLFNFRINGSGVTQLDGLWKGSQAVALSGGKFIVRVPITTSGVITPAGTIEVIWPVGLPGGPVY